jgi:hypothetical protein
VIAKIWVELWDEEARIALRAGIQQQQQLQQQQQHPQQLQQEQQQQLQQDHPHQD